MPMNNVEEKIELRRKILDFYSKYNMIQETSLRVENNTRIMFDQRSNYYPEYDVIQTTVLFEYDHGFYLEIERVGYGSGKIRYLPFFAEELKFFDMLGITTSEYQLLKTGQRIEDWVYSE